MVKEITPEILNALKQGDHHAFEDVFVTYFTKIKIFIFSYVKSDADAEELADNIFINLWENRESININKSINSYLYTIAKNTALNFIKFRLVRENYISSYTFIQDDNTSEDDLIAQETALLIDMIVDKMPAQRKAIYQLSRKDGLTNEEIAIRLNTSKRNVESQISLALKEIRKVVIQFIVLFGL